MHHFPNPDKFPERFKAWVNLVGGKLETSSDYRYYKKKMVCDIHFIDDHRNRYKRLNALAVPTLHLHGSSHTLQNIPATTVATENETCPSLPTTGSSHTLQNIPSTSTLATENQPCPSLPTTGSSHTLQNIPSTSTLATENQPCSSLPTTGPSDTLPNIPSTVATGNQPCSSIPLTKDETYAGVIASAITREHNYSVNSNRKILKGAQKRKPLYPEPAKTNRLEIRRLQSEICRLRKKGASFKQRLETKVYYIY
ncbi:RNA polymerase II elongation factor ell1-like [Plutella xylostella]|uniref:RNA polymerase II elongation factor ell1-like n=1 Tax=Plutella xylostella TaxID=51655 RepID=UPI002032B52E|nr:RNA polymerase II elongation factor ell1-like [Plutella xylostella]